MGASQGVILIMVGALALYLMWSNKSPFNRGNDGGATNNGTGNIPPGQHTQPGDTNPRSVPDGCLGTVNDYWCPGPPGIGTHYVNGGVNNSGHPNQSTIN